MRKKKPIEQIIWTISGVLLFVTLWWILSLIIRDDLLLPTPYTVVRDLFVASAQKVFFASVFGTLGRAALSFAISFGLALVLAVLAASTRVLAQILRPLLTIQRTIPTMSIILLAIIWLRSKNSPILIGCLISFPIMYSAFLTAIQGIDRSQIEMCRVYSVSPALIFRDLYLPSIMPVMVDTSATAIGLTMKVVIAGEVLAQTANSMGRQMNIAKLNLDTSSLLAWTLLAVLISAALEIIIRLSARLTTIRKKVPLSV